MLGRTAASLYWMARYIERAENIARLTEVCYRGSLVPDASAGHRADWEATLIAAGCMPAFAATGAAVTAERVRDFLLFDRAHASSVRSCLESARNNARSVRTALTREMWEALNGAWNEFAAIRPADLGPGRLPELLDWVRGRAALFRGAMLGTLLRDEGYHFSQLGTFVERGDNTARILDHKYMILLPSNEAVGGERNLYQWEMVLRSVGAHRAYRHFHKDRYRPGAVAEFLMLRPEMPRSLRFCAEWLIGSLRPLHERTGGGAASLALAEAGLAELAGTSMEAVFRAGLHEFLAAHLSRQIALSDAIGAGFHFN
jgi:uncharacterized alpha-E superfamily protein